MRRPLVLIVMCTGMFFVLLDVTIVNVALPSIRHDLHASPSGLEWVVDADTLGFACLMLSAGTIGDRTGRKRLVLLGLGILGVGSALCALAGSLGVLLAGRALQGIGGALLLPQTLAVITAAYPEPGEQARAIGVWAGASSLALPAGPLLGGFLVDRFGWPAVFWVNVPIALLALALAAALVGDPPRSSTRRLDLPGQLLVTLGLGLVTAGLVEAGDRSWSSALVVALVAAGVGALATFAAWQVRAPQPMIPHGLLRRPTFLAANAVGLLMNFGGVGVLYLVTLYLQVTQGRSALAAGLLLLPATLPLAVLAPAAGRIGSRIGWRTPMVLGMGAAATSGVLLSTLHRSSSSWEIAPVLLVLGVGLTLNTAPMVSAVMASAPQAEASTASAANNTARQIGSAFGVAVLGAVAGDPGAHRFPHALHVAGLVAAAGWAVAAVVAIRVTPRSTVGEHAGL